MPAEHKRLAVQEEEDFALPQQLQAQMAAYAARFSIVKTPRKLVWCKHLGSVDLTLTVGAREVDFTVAPIHAAIIMHFKVGHLILRISGNLHGCSQQHIQMKNVKEAQGLALHVLMCYPQ